MEFRFRIEEFPGRDPNEVARLHMRITRRGVNELIALLRRVEPTIGPDQVGHFEITGGELYPGFDQMNAIKGMPT